MKKSIFNILISIMCCLVMTGCDGKTQEAEKPDKPADMKESVQEEQESGEEQPISVEDEKDTVGSTKNDPAEDTEKEEEKNKLLTEADCIEEINMLRETEAVLPAETELLAELARCVTVSRILDEKGMIFSEMDNDRRAALRYQLINDVMWGETAISGAIPIKDSEGRYDADKLIPLDDAIEFFRDVYGEESFYPAEYEHVKDGYMLLSFGDGDPWHLVEHMQFFEDDGYFLLTGPAFYEDNGGNISFLGYADILYAKNPESRYGVTLLYGRYRNEKINISFVETSSELPAANGKTYSGQNLVDGDYSTVWSEGVPGTGVGETITLHLDKKQPVYGVLFCNGYTAGYEQYNNNGMLTDVKVDFGGGKEAEGSMMEGYAYEGFSAGDLADCNRSKVELDEPVITDTVTITITGAKKGVKYDDTCVSEIQLY